MTRKNAATAMLCAALVALALQGSVGAGAAPGPTIADFAVKIYRGTLSRQEAMAALRAVAPSAQSPEARLTEGSLAEIMTGFGIRSTTQQSGMFVDPGRADAALTFIWQAMSNPGTRGGAAGGGTIDLAECQVDRNIWICMNCCVSQGGAKGACGYFCTFGVSPSRP